MNQNRSGSSPSSTSWGRDMDAQKLKTLLGIPMEDISRDLALAFVLEDVEETILNYCGIEKLPKGLENTAYRMAMDLYRNENVGQEEAATGPVASLSEGDTSTSFHQCADGNFKDTVLKNYRPGLNRYRKAAFR